MRSGAIALFSVVKLIYIFFKDRLAGDCSFELKNSYQTTGRTSTSGIRTHDYFSRT